MRKLWVILTLLTLTLIGCDTLANQKANWDECLKGKSVDATVDQKACYDNAIKWKGRGELVGGIAGSAFPGAAVPAEKIGGGLFFALSMLIGGAALKKKKVEPAPQP